MAIIMNKPMIKFGGRLLYSIHQKNDGKAFSLSYQETEESISRTSILSFKNKQDAMVFAYMLEADTKKKPSEKILQEFEFKKLYIRKWDSFHLKEYLHIHYANLFVLDNFDYDKSVQLKGKIYEASEDPNEYIDILNSMYNK